jgi:fructose-1,6-bisphosphatase/inositol monophosphatase family enzyme
VWLLDPLDGTANFAAGTGPFAMMAALLSRGEAVASWILDPQTGRLAQAQRGAARRPHPLTALPGSDIDWGMVNMTPAACASTSCCTTAMLTLPRSTPRLAG